MKKITILTLLMLQCALAGAQVQVEANIDSISILIGEQAHVSLSVTATKGKHVTFPRFKAQQMLTPGVEVLDDSQADTSSIDNGMVKITRRYTVTSFDEKVYYIPPMVVKVDGRQYKSRSLALKVLTVDVDTLHPNKFYPPKDVQDNPFDWSEWKNLFMYSLLLVIMAACSYYLYTRLKENKPIIKRVRIVKRIPPHLKAMGEIEKLKADRVLNTDNPKEYYTKLTDTLRQYIRERFGFNAMEMTSSEIISRLQDNEDKEKTDELRMLFETADLVKFAKYSTLINENDKNLVNAVNFINSTKQDTVQTEEKVKPRITETEKQSMRSRKFIVFTITVLGLFSVAILIYICWQMWILVM